MELSRLPADSSPPVSPGSIPVTLQQPAIHRAGQIAPMANPDGVVGAKAVRDLAGVLMDAGRPEDARRVFAAAGLRAFLKNPPSEMVDERLVAQLYSALEHVLPGRDADAVAELAGARTARHLLTGRIPKPAQLLMRSLPARHGARRLMRSIKAHAWTFAGTGRVSIQTGYPAVLTIEANPLARPGCAWHVGVLRTLFQALVDPDAAVVETTCCARGDAACRFEVTAPAARPRHGHHWPRHWPPARRPRH